ncbi:hypothetical protein HDU86_000055 [Geranomyces michiganensis]|nr:hypothetical protein HDU86_000055 [Geranomyces michiganensis]
MLFSKVLVLISTALVGTTTASPLTSRQTACGAGLTPCGRDCFKESEGLYHCENGVLKQGPAPGNGTPNTPVPPSTGGGPPPANPNGRTIQVVNQCTEDIWVGIQGDPILNNGGLFLPRGAVQNIQAPNVWTAGRIWPRTSCKNVNGRLVCETGDCGSAANGFGVECRGVGGQPPATLAEFTFQDGGKSDFYDLSNVDGHSVGIRIEAFGTQVNNPGLGRFNCGSPACSMDMSKCPPELTRKTSSGRTVCLAIHAAVRDANLRNAFADLRAIFENPDTLSLVSCSCDCGPNCGCTDARSKHCCSPYNNDPNERGGKCRVEEWPVSRSQGAGTAFPKRYDEVFKQQCPDAYSWQFDDHKSTFQCVKANYRVTFCG